MSLLERFFEACACGLLLRRVKEDRGAVLRAPVRALAIDLGGIVVLPEDL